MLEALTGARTLSKVCSSAATMRGRRCASAEAVGFVSLFSSPAGVETGRGGGVPPFARRPDCATHSPAAHSISIPKRKGAIHRLYFMKLSSWKGSSQ
jgi:hypothetical protein